MDENFLMNYDATTGEIKGFYLKSIHGDNIPEPCLEITPEKHDFFMQNNGKYRINPTTLQEELIPVPPETDAQKLARYDALTVQYIREQYSADDEYQILREKLSGTDTGAFDTYNTFVETCKTKAHTEVYGS